MTVLGLSLLLLLGLAAALGEKAENFVATDEWQEIKPGQRVPAGLHYRMNLETGKKEAKILSNDTTGGGGGLTLVGRSEEEDESGKATKEEGKAKVMEANRDIEHIRVLMANFENSTGSGKVAILEDLDYYLHQVDNARDFVTLKGLQTIVVPSLTTWKEEDDDLRVPAAASMLLGSACQSNQPVKAAALSLGVVEILLENLSRAKASMTLQSRTVFALSSIVRGYPNATERFAEARGFDSLLDDVLLLEAGEDEARARLKLKCLALVTGLWLEDDAAVAPRVKERMDDGWCRAFVLDGSLFSKLDLDRVEVLARVLHRFCPFCVRRWASKGEGYIAAWLGKAEDLIDESMLTEDDEDFREYLANVRQNLRSVRREISGFKSEL